MKLKKILLALMAPFLAAPAATAGAPTHVKHPDWSRNAVIYEVNTRQYTPEGTFNAFAANLPRLKKLGVDILWFMPIHPISEKNRKGSLGSYYAVQDYKAVNPEFGTLADFQALVKKAHDMGMKVIIDWVPNHTGCDNAWLKNHADRYAHNDKGELYGPYDWTDTYKLDYTNPDTRAAMIDAMSYWLREADIDGFRCDVAAEVPVYFWNEARPALQAIKPDLFMLAEASSPALHDYGFDMGYNWPMKDLFSDIAATHGQYTFLRDGETEPAKRAEKHAMDIPALVEQQAKDYPADTYLMNMITNHDLNSWEGTEMQRLGNFADAFAVLTYTLPGMPLIYTGQEVGMNRALQFFEKDTAPDFRSNAVTAFYTALNALKRSRKELRAGTAGAPMRVYATANPDVLVFERREGNQATYTGVNLSNKPVTIQYTDAAPSPAGALTDAISGTTLTALPTTLVPGGYFVVTEN